MKNWLAPQVLYCQEVLLLCSDSNVSVHDLQATRLYALGLDHRQLTYPHDGRDDSLPDAEVTKARVVHDLLA